MLCADYTPGNPLITYPAGVADVLIGVRHSDLAGGTGTAEGFDEFLAGSINEARIYDTALSAAQIASVALLPTVYADALENDWQDWGYNSIRNLTNTTPVHSGGASLAVTITSAYGAVVFHHSDIASAAHAHVIFWINGGATGGHNLQLYGTLHVGSDESQTQPQQYLLNPLPTNSWQRYAVPLAALGVADATNFTGFAIQDAAGTAQPEFYLDDIRVINLPVVLNTHDSGPGSLRQTIAGAEAGDTITFGPALSGQTILLTSGQITRGKNLTIDASTLPGGITLSGNHASRLFEVNAGTTNALLNLALVGGNGVGTTFSGSGGAVFNAGTLALTNCVVRDNEIPFGGVGGGLFTTGAGSSATVVGCVFSTNRTTGGSSGGGGIFADNSTLDCSDSIFFGNISSNTAGAIHLISGATGTLARCTFDGNTAPGGGAVRNTLATLMLTNCIFTANVATSDGGALWDQGTTVASQCSFTGNAATNYGGGIFSLENTTVNECSLVANTGAVGAALTSFGTVTISGCTVASNTATIAGGGIANAGSVAINQSTVTGNLAPANGGGIYSQNTLAVSQCTVVANTTAGPGGGIVINGGTASLTNTIVAGNSATSSTNIFGSFTGANNLTSGNPLLAPLGNYGGPTQTMPPLPGSPAINAGGLSAFITDQRGYPRTSGNAVDIGSVELQVVPGISPPALVNPVWSDAGGSRSFQFTFTNVTAADFTVLTSTDVALPLNNWTPIGYAVEMPANSGNYQFINVPATDEPQRFFGVSSPLPSN